MFLITGFVQSDSLQRVEDALKQTVDLTRQFMETQQLLYHAYTSTLASNYHYTSIKETEDVSDSIV